MKTRILRTALFLFAYLVTSAAQRDAIPTKRPSASR